MTTTAPTEATRSRALEEGRVVAIAGPVIDVEFPPHALPEINHAVDFDLELDGTTHTITAEVAQQIGEGRVTVNRARKVQRFLSQPFFVAEVFTGVPGIFVPIDETVESFEALANGDLDVVPEQAFLNVGGVESVLAKAKRLQEEAG